MFFTTERVIKDCRYILLIGFLCGFNFRVGFGNVYAQNIDSERTKLWVELTGIISSFDVAWCVRGDFNIVLSAEEKIGVSLCPSTIIYVLR